jgi:phosphotransferase system enzyme I (PtsI)
VESIFEQFAGILEKAGDDLIAARAADLRDVKRRIQGVLLGVDKPDLSRLPGNVVLAAVDLSPSDTASLDRKHIKGIVIERGGAISHTAILAKSFRIPAVVGAEGIMSAAEGEDILLDAVKGEIFSGNEKEAYVGFMEAKINFSKKEAEAAGFRALPGMTSDGERIYLGLNIGAPGWEEDEQQYDFVGLFRTEFFYMESRHMPSEEKQFHAYRQVVEQAKGRVVTLRTLDIGGDKELPYVSRPKEGNPLLGRRAIRLCFAEPGLFLAQLRAALRASAHGKLQIMFPMVTCLGDIQKAKEYVETAKLDLRNRKEWFDEKIKIGIMIEIPSIAVVADQAAAMVDFASIGSNDLCQYLCAADRMNPAVTNSYQGLSPAMLRMMGYVAREFGRAGKPICVCGELAGSPGAALALVGLGIRQLSMESACLSSVKQALAHATIHQLEQEVKELINLSGEEAVMERLNRFLE